ncbi:hypothetical protein SAMN05444584_1407 [Acinetobacter apis]|uniref:Uncharacterized protein n=1 Tax=Acinetobacter apis TaxID=1229165 RepID=A0A217EG43_9GAMM|nr:hypothetical protein SAMN05444584_1407 [Acinetobacter apis]
MQCLRNTGIAYFHHLCIRNIWPFSIVCLIALSACTKQPPADALEAHSHPHTHEVETPMLHTASPARDDLIQLQSFVVEFKVLTEHTAEEIQALKQQNMLAPAYITQQQATQALAAVNMLNDLELQTKRGQSIQALLLEYWSHQAMYFKQQVNEHTVDSQAYRLPANKEILVRAHQEISTWEATLKP